MNVGCLITNFQGRGHSDPPPLVRYLVKNTLVGQGLSCLNVLKLFVELKLELVGVKSGAMHNVKYSCQLPKDRKLVLSSR